MGISVRTMLTAGVCGVTAGAIILAATLTEQVSKGGKTFTRGLNADRIYTAPQGGEVRLHGRSLMFLRNVGHLMTNPAILYTAADGSTKEIPEGIMDAVITTTIGVTGATVAQHLHFRHFDFRGVAVLSVLILPLACLDTAFQVQLTALLHILRSDFCQLAIADDAVPLGQLAFFTGVLVLPGLGGCETKIAHCIPVRHVAGFGVGTNIADKDHFVD
mgnify:CR=1 FL=1